MLLINLCEEVCAERPVFLHDAGGVSHTAGDAGVNDSLEIGSCLDGGRIEILAGSLLDRVSVVDDTACFYANREAVGFAVDRDGLGGVLDPILIGKVNCVLSSQRVNVFCVNHGNGVGVVRRITGGQVGCNCVGRIVNFYGNAFFFGVLSSHFFQLTLDFHFGIEDGNGDITTAA